MGHDCYNYGCDCYMDDDCGCYGTSCPVVEERFSSDREIRAMVEKLAKRVTELEGENKRPRG